MSVSQVGKNPVAVCTPGDGPGVVYNRDAANPVFWGLTASQATAGDASILDAGAGIAVDGSAPVYVASLGPVVAVDFIPGGSNRSSQNINITGGVIQATITNSSIDAVVSGNVGITGTAAVNITGQSLSLDVSAQTVKVNGVAGTFPAGSNASLVSVSNQAITNATPYNTPIIDMLNYTAFNLWGYAYCTSQGTAGAPLTAQVIIQWWADALATQLLDFATGQVWLANGNGAGGNFFIKGPCHARYVTVTIADQSTVAGITLGQFQLYGTGRTLTENIWHQVPPYGHMTAGVTMIGGQTPEDETMPGALVNYALPASATQWYPLALCNRRAFIQFETSVALAANACLCAAYSLENGEVVAGSGGPFNIWNPGNGAGVPVSAEIDLPTYPCYMVFHSTATASQVYLTATTRGS